MCAPIHRHIQCHRATLSKVSNIPSTRGIAFALHLRSERANFRQRYFIGFYTRNGKARPPSSRSDARSTLLISPSFFSRPVKGIVRQGKLQSCPIRLFPTTFPRLWKTKGEEREGDTQCLSRSETLTMRVIDIAVSLSLLFANVL